MKPDYQQCHDAGMTANEAARARGVTVESARYWADRRGLSWRFEGQARKLALPVGMDELPPLSECDLDPVACREKWASVLRDQWFDVFGDLIRDDSVSRKREAEAWLGTRECATVCALVGLEFDYIMREYRATMANPDHAQPRRRGPSAAE